MFDKQYQFSGEHALKVWDLTNVFYDGIIKNAKIFERNIDVYEYAPLVGFLYNRRSPKDNTKDEETKQTYTQNIMGDRVILSSNELWFNFRLIMLLDREYEPDPEKRINKAFRIAKPSPEDEDRYESYVRGGVEVMHEKLIEGANTLDDYIEKLYDFVADFNIKFNTAMSENEILKLCI